MPRRTTSAIDSDARAAARAIARQQNQPVGKVVRGWARNSLGPPITLTERSGVPLLLAMLLLGSLLGAGLGLVLGTLVVPNRINIVFSLVFPPLLYTGCSQYPWPSLSRLPWFQYVTAANPMTYVSEAMRAALVPSVPHIAPWICLIVLCGSLAALISAGLKGFYGRAVD